MKTFYILTLMAAILSGCSTPVSNERVQPQRISATMAVYPREMLAAGKQGSVLLELVVTADGTIRDLKVVSADDPLFAESALRAARQWKFTPGRIGGRPVNARMQYPVYFTIKDNEPNKALVPTATSVTPAADAPVAPAAAAAHL